MKLFIRRNDKDYGPYPIEQIKQLLNEGRLLKNDQASEDKNIWQELDLFLARIKEPPNLEDLTKLSPKETSTRNETANLQPIAKVAKTIAPHKEEHKTNPKEETTESARIDKPKHLESNKSQEKTSGLNKKTKSKKKLLLMFLSSCIIFTGVACYFLLNGGKIIQREVPLDALKQDGNFFYAYKEDIPFTGIGFSEFPNGQKNTVTTFKGGKPDDLSEVWWENGNLKYSLNFQNGLLHGTNKAWHQNGQKLSEGSTVGGKKEGNWEFWSDNGTRIKTVGFLNDQKEGLYQEWDENGQKIIEGNFSKDQKVGIWQEWHSDGELKHRGNFINGKQDGMQKSWKASLMELKSEKDYKLGVLVYSKTWLKIGNIGEGPIKNGNMHGEWITYDKNETILYKDIWDNGKLVYDGGAERTKKNTLLQNILEKYVKKKILFDDNLISKLPFYDKSKENIILDHINSYNSMYDKLKKVNFLYYIDHESEFNEFLEYGKKIDILIDKYNKNIIHNNLNLFFKKELEDSKFLIASNNSKSLSKLELNELINLKIKNNEAIKKIAFGYPTNRSFTNLVELIDKKMNINEYLVNLSTDLLTKYNFTISSKKTLKEIHNLELINGLESIVIKNSYFDDITFLNKIEKPIRLNLDKCLINNFDVIKKLKQTSIYSLSVNLQRGLNLIHIFENPKLKELELKSWSQIPNYKSGNYNIIELKDIMNDRQWAEIQELLLKRSSNPLNLTLNSCFIERSIDQHKTIGSKIRSINNYKIPYQSDWWEESSDGDFIKINSIKDLSNYKQLSRQWINNRERFHRLVAGRNTDMKSKVFNIDKTFLFSVDNDGLENNFVYLRDLKFLNHNVINKVYIGKTYKKINNNTPLFFSPDKDMSEEYKFQMINNKLVKSLEECSSDDPSRAIKVISIKHPIDHDLYSSINMSRVIKDAMTVTIYDYSLNKEITLYN